jgi:hypothetical protein
MVLCRVTFRFRARRPACVVVLETRDAGVPFRGLGRAGQGLVSLLMGCKLVSL